MKNKTTNPISLFPSLGMEGGQFKKLTMYDEDQNIEASNSTEPFVVETKTKTKNMKHYPILFQTQMVKGIEDLTKSQTRRTKNLKEINKNPDAWYPYYFDVDDDGILRAEFYNGTYTKSIKAPYGKIGDVLWVKETTCHVMLDHAHDLLEGAKEKTQLVYKSNVHGDWMEYAKEKYGYKWKPSIYMPKEACRIFLEVTDVRVERLLDISEDDAVKEGIVMNNKPWDGWYFMENVYSTDSPVMAFEQLWESINGKESLESNPWVFAYSFKKVDKPSDFNK